MKIDFLLEINDALGKSSIKNDSISFLEFVKTFSFAGINSTSNPLQTLFRFLENIYGFAPSFIDHKFHLHPELENDPTEKGQFSNKVGRAFAVYFAKKQSGAMYVYSYECALKKYGKQITGSRPDYYCDTSKQSFSLEAKGYCCSSISDTKMQVYKNQALAGSLNVNFSIASATFNIYNKPKIKYYDPENDNKNYDYKFAEELRKDYYKGVLKLISSPYFINSQSPEKDFYAYKAIIDLNIFTILVHKSIVEQNDLLNTLHPIKTENMFIDTDGIGLIINLDEIKHRIQTVSNKS